MHPHTSIVRDRLRKRQPVFCFKSNIALPMVVELLGGAGIDCLWLDMEHFPTTTETMALLIMACRASDTDAMVRVPNGEFLMAAKMLDSGADGIMYPRCRDVAEVRTLVDWTRFAPLGRRGADTGVAAAGYSQFTAPQSIEHARNNTVLMVQIETPEALEHVDEIAAVPGVDILFIGPGDLSVELGIPCEAGQPKLVDAVAKVAAAAKRHNIAWGMPAFSADHAQQLLKDGAQVVSLASDTSILNREVRGLRATFEKMGVPFGR